MSSLKTPPCWRQIGFTKLPEKIMGTVDILLLPYYVVDGYGTCSIFFKVSPYSLNIHMYNLQGKSIPLPSTVGVAVVVVVETVVNAVAFSSVVAFSPVTMDSRVTTMIKRLKNASLLILLRSILI